MCKTWQLIVRYNKLHNLEHNLDRGSNQIPK